MTDTDTESDSNDPASTIPRSGHEQCFRAVADLKAQLDTLEQELAKRPLTTEELADTAGIEAMGTLVLLTAERDTLQERLGRAESDFEAIRDHRCIYCKHEGCDTATDIAVAFLEQRES